MTTEQKSPARGPVVCAAEAPRSRERHGEKFDIERARLGPLIGAKQIGCGYAVVPPGKRGFPFHNHHVNEELFVILEGEGVYRYGSTEYPVRAGDVCAAPAGGAETAHQLINTGAGPLAYLMISTSHDAEILEYPDSGKFIAAHRHGAGGGYASAPFKVAGRRGDWIDYWDGE
ncbi:cupin domain-containing protein [Neomegalonema sp.]|uniref:cupin domain-containing protein n=1 Tax=Neomegalonema sp. TaxID=2039713 RepID=UPI0026030BAB|nr:cupin domain-containing protein [Neomegalonema sp.]MDD2869531.1 cupin domain-containing protein [Neomegalonema sp.]